MDLKQLLTRVLVAVDEQEALEFLVVRLESIKMVKSAKEARMTCWLKPPTISFKPLK